MYGESFVIVKKFYVEFLVGKSILGSLVLSPKKWFNKLSVCMYSYVVVIILSLCGPRAIAKDNRPILF